jgi:uncharacterized linocin/CFP29 family protein
MNNLHRELAPISDAAWAEIEEETTRTLKRYLAGRRVVDVPTPSGVGLSAVGTGHLLSIAPPAEDILARQREVKALVELRVPFELTRAAIDDVDRGAEDSDWQPAKDAAKKIAFAEDRAIFNGYPGANIQGIREGTSNPIMTLPTDVRDYPDAVAQALSQLRLVGVNGPYSVLLGAKAYTELAETRDHGYPVLEHVKRIVDGNIIWAPAIEGAFVLTTRGGDFELNLGQDISIGYLSHTDTTVRLYLQESFTFRLLTSEASVVIASGCFQNETKFGRTLETITLPLEATFKSLCRNVRTKRTKRTKSPGRPGLLVGKAPTSQTGRYLCCALRIGDRPVCHPAVVIQPSIGGPWGGGGLSCQRINQECAWAHPATQFFLLSTMNAAERSGVRRPLW